jgi:hypothetical protein
LASTGERDATVRVWDANSAVEVLTAQTLAQREGLGIRFLPGGSNRLCFATRQGDIHVWEAASWTATTKAGVAEAAVRNTGAVTTADTASSSPRVESGDIVVLTTPETLSTCLLRLAEALRNQPIPADATQGDGGLKCEGDIYNALAKLTTQRKDVILAVNDLSINDPVLAAELARMAGEIRDVSTTAPTLKIRRAGQNRTLRPVLTEATERTITRRMPRAEAVKFFELQAERLEKYATNTLRQNQMYAAEIGEPAQGSRALNGIWVFADTELERIKLESYYRKLGLSVNDRVVRIDGQPVTDVDRLLNWCRDMAPAVSGGGSSGFELRIERGRLQRINIDVVFD